MEPERVFWWTDFIGETLLVSVPGVLAVILLELMRPGAVSSFISPSWLVVMTLAALFIFVWRRGELSIPRTYLVFVAILLGAILATAISVPPIFRLLAGVMGAVISVVAGRAITQSI